MSDTKAFPAGDVLGIIVDRLFGDMAGLCAVLDYMTGENVHTHQIPRIAAEATAVLTAMSPVLLRAQEDAEMITRDNCLEWLARWEARHGATIRVPKFTADQHERIDPLSELAQRVHPDKITVLPPAPGTDP